MHDLFIFSSIAFVIVGCLSNYLLFKMAQDVNSHPSEHEHFSLSWWTLGKMGRLYRLHRRLYPNGGHRGYFAVSCGVALLLMIVTAIIGARMSPFR